MNVQGQKYISSDSDINSRPPIRSKNELKDIYPECFSGIGTLNNYKYHIELDPKVKLVLHPPRKTAFSLQPYGITIKYVHSQKVPFADALSRVSPSDNTEIKRFNITIHDVTTTLYHFQVEATQKATREDQVLQLLMQQMMQGWPDHIKQLPAVLNPFWLLRDDSSIEHSCVTFQGRFYKPSVLGAGSLRPLHQGYPGIVKMKLGAQTSISWIGMNKEIDNHVIHCKPCQILSKSHHKELLQTIILNIH